MHKVHALCLKLKTDVRLKLYLVIAALFGAVADSTSNRCSGEEEVCF